MTTTFNVKHNWPACRQDSFCVQLRKRRMRRSQACVSPVFPFV